MFVPDASTTSITSTNWEVTPQPGNMDFCVVIRVTGKSTQLAPWELRADLRKAPFNGVALADVQSQGDEVTLRAAAGDSSTLVITGGSGNRLINSSTTVRVRLCVYYAPVPPKGDAAWYITSVTRGEWTDVKACQVLTVKGRVADLLDNPFFFTWVGDLDLTDAKQRISSAGRTVNYVDWAPYPGQDRHQFSINPTASNPVADRYALTGGRMTAIRGTSQVSITACVMGY